ncbi:MAG TPA: NAD(P)H-dependent oxidoreductase [Jiangellaceae bacterium]|nr:NAD(P)H-dependent oxidoreductase [Jiangellaceae bacterium]
MTHLQIIVASPRRGAFGDRPATWVQRYLDEHQDVRTEIVALRDYPLPLFDQAPPAHTLREYPSDEIARLGRMLDRADGFIIVTPEYNHGYPASVKNAMDHTFIEWRRKPVAFIGYGSVGGARAIEQLRQVVIELEMAPLRHAVHILPDVMGSATSGNDPSDVSAFAPLQPKLATMIDDLLWWSIALAAHRDVEQRDVAQRRQAS